MSILGRGRLPNFFENVSCFDELGPDIHNSIINLLSFSYLTFKSVNWQYALRTGVENSSNFYSSYMPICIRKFNNLHWKQSKFLLVLQHEVLIMASGRVEFPSPEEY